MTTPARLACRLRLAAVALLWCGASQAQFASAPPALPPALLASQADSDQDYRRDGAKHLYASYPMRVYRGKMPPMLYGVAVVETDIDAEGNITDVRIRRPPAAPEVGPWIQQMIRKAGPFPPPARLGQVTYSEIWLVHKGGNFQLDTLTEGQH
jgi:protein TonB